MKILFVGLARSLWLFHVPAWNAKGMNLQPVIDGIKKRYEFAQAPKHPLDFDQSGGLSGGLSFKSGTFVTKSGAPVLISVTIFNDGLMADTLSDTDDSTEFLKDLTNWVQNEYGFVPPSHIRTAYVGQIDFETDARLVSLNAHLSGFVELLERRYKPADGKARKFDCSSLGFWTEDSRQLPSAPAPFRWERKIGAPFSDNHYFSEAPLETKAHVEVLHDLERLMENVRKPNRND